MENFMRAIGAIACWLYAVAASASDLPALEATPLTGLEFFGKTYGPATSACDLGFIAVGSPMVVSRTSSWSSGNGVAVSDRLLAVNGNVVHDYDSLTSALRHISRKETVELSVFRAGRHVDVEIQCYDATKLIMAREEVLASATESRWNDCIRATYAEELLWGGPNSISAGLRLWCHQSSLRTDEHAQTNAMHPIGAFLMYDYGVQLVEELSRVPGNFDEIRAQVNTQSKRISDSGREDLAASLNELLAATQDL